jgi:hypothetical protein
MATFFIPKKCGNLTLMEMQPIPVARIEPPPPPPPVPQPPPPPPPPAPKPEAATPKVIEKEKIVEKEKKVEVPVYIEKEKIVQVPVEIPVPVSQPGPQSYYGAYYGSQPYYASCNLGWGWGYDYYGRRYYGYKLFRRPPRFDRGFNSSFGRGRQIHPQGRAIQQPNRYSGERVTRLSNQNGRTINRTSNGRSNANRGQHR